MQKQKLEQREDGYYRCKYHNQQFYGKTQEEALEKRTAYIDEEKAGLDQAKRKLTFRKYAEQWIKTYRADCCLSMQRQYKNIIDAAADFLEANDKPYIRDIVASDIQDLCNTLNVRSPSYASKFISTIKGIFASAQGDGAILRNPAVTIKRPKVQKIVGHRALEPWERRLINETYQGHELGLVVMVMLYAGLRRGEALYLNVDRDVDFNRRTITVRGAVSFVNGNQPIIIEGKTEAAQRTIPLLDDLADALKGHHGLLIRKENGEPITETMFHKKYVSYLCYLETRLNGIQKRWYGKTNEQKELKTKGLLPAWQDVRIKCHDYRVDFCTQAYEAGIPIKTLQYWMGHSDATMIMNVYAKITEEKEHMDAMRMNDFLNHQRNRAQIYDLRQGYGN